MFISCPLSKCLCLLSSEAILVLHYSLSVHFIMFKDFKYVIGMSNCRSGTSSGLNPVHNGRIGQEEPRGSSIGFVHGRPEINMKPACLATVADAGFPSQWTHFLSPDHFALI